MADFCAEIGTMPPIINPRDVSVRQVFCSFRIDEPTILC